MTEQHGRLGSAGRRTTHGWIMALLMAVMIGGALPAGHAHTEAAITPPPTSASVPNLGPSPYKCGVGCWNDLPNSLAVSYLANMTVSPKIARPGDTVSGNIQMLSSWQTTHGFHWVNIGQRLLGCGVRDLFCVWKAGPATNAWQTVSINIDNDTNVARTDDYYAVVGKNNHILDGYVRDSAGVGMRGVPLWISGLTNTMAYHPQTDGNGFYSAFVAAGNYAVRVDVPQQNINAQFSPSKQFVTLGARASADFVGEDHLTLKVDKGAVSATGLEQATVTVREFDPFGTAVPNVLIQMFASGPPSLVCSAMPGHLGYVEPANLQSNGQPLYLPAFQRTDSAGVLTDTVYFGTEAGTWTVSAEDAAYAKAHPTSTSSPLFKVASVSVTPDKWLPATPALFPTPQYFTLGTRNGATVYVPALGTTAMWDLSHAIWGALHRLTFPSGTVNILQLPSSQVQPSLILGGDPLQNQKALLRWAQARLPLEGLNVAPISGPGGTRPGIVIFSHHHPLGADSLVLDMDMVASMVNAATWAASPNGLPSVAQWETQIGGPAILDYVLPTPEQNRTYQGFPYLPVPNAADPFQQDLSFAACMQPAT